MTKLEALKEALRRDGESEEKIAKMLVKINLANALPPDAHDEIPRGQEEAFIQFALLSKWKMENLPPLVKAKFEKLLVDRQRKN